MFDQDLRVCPELSHLRVVEHLVGPTGLSRVLVWLGPTGPPSVVVCLVGTGSCRILSLSVAWRLDGACGSAQRCRVLRVRGGFRVRVGLQDRRGLHQTVSGWKCHTWQLSLGGLRPVGHASKDVDNNVGIIGNRLRGSHR